MLLLFSTYLAGLVLSDLVLGVLFAIFALTVGAASLWYVHLVAQMSVYRLTCVREC